MRALNFIDLAFQSLILGLVIILSLAVSFTGNFESMAIVVMYGALFLGPWQFFSSLITTLSKGRYLRWRIIHLLSSVAYFILAGVAAYFLKDLDGDGLVRTIGGFFGFGIPAVLALFYYYITFKSFRA